VTFSAIRMDDYVWIIIKEKEIMCSGTCWCCGIQEK